jgi:hypothetical protein
LELNAVLWWLLAVDHCSSISLGFPYSVLFCSVPMFLFSGEGTASAIAGKGESMDYTLLPHTDLNVPTPSRFFHFEQRSFEPLKLLSRRSYGPGSSYWPLVRCVLE